MPSFNSDGYEGSITMDGYVIGLRDEMILMTKDTIEIHVI
jgi:hypothetical protein